MSTDVVVHATADLLAKAAAARLVTRLVDAQAARGMATIVLTGGGVGGGGRATGRDRGGDRHRRQRTRGRHRAVRRRGARLGRRARRDRGPRAHRPRQRVLVSGAA